MVSEWKTDLLGSLCIMKNGYAFKSKDFVSEGIPVIKIKNVKPNRILVDDLSYVTVDVAEQRKKWLIAKGEILLTMTGNRADGSPESWVGKAAIFNESTPYLLNQRVSSLKAKDDTVIDTKYLGYYLSSWQSQLYFIKRANSSGGQANISPEIVMSMPVHYPPLEAQKKIVSILSVIDEKIKINTAVNDNLQQQIEALLWEYLSEDSTIPVKLGDYLYIKGRIGWKGLKKSEYLDQSGYRIINGETLTKAGIDWDKAGYISEERYIESPEIMLQIGDILLSKDGTIGKIGYVDSLDLPTSVASGIFVIRNIKPDIISTTFIYYLLKSKLFDAFIAARTEGSVIPHLYQKDFMDFIFPLPNAERMSAFEKMAAPMFERVMCNLKENRSLANLRDSLLPKLMSGEIDTSKIII